MPMLSNGLKSKIGLRMRFLINRFKKSFSLVGFLGKLLILFLIVGAYVLAKVTAQKEQFKNPEIVIDNSEIDCGCEEDSDSVEAADEEISGEADPASKSLAEEEDQLLPQEESEEALSDPAFLNQPEALFVASRSGKKYYPLGCKLADRIKKENQVFYKIAEEAEADGKEMAEGCLAK
jgi:hypothetical protein